MLHELEKQPHWGWKIPRNISRKNYIPYHNANMHMGFVRVSAHVVIDAQFKNS
jgi:hypothetical protein